MARLGDERGIALVLALMGMVLLTTLGGAVVVLTSTETTIAARFRDGLEAFYAAEGGIARALVDLRTADWDEVRAGRAKSSFADGTFDLVNAARDLESLPGSAPWHPYAYGWFEEMLSGSRAARRLFVVVWVAADPSEADNLVVLRSHAYGPQGARRMVEATVEQTMDGPRVKAWREWP